MQRRQNSAHTLLPSLTDIWTALHERRLPLTGFTLLSALDLQFKTGQEICSADCMPTSLGQKFCSKHGVHWNSMVLPVHLLPDISRNTLLMCRSLKPLLERIVELGMSYTWGHPFHLNVCKGSCCFSLCHLSELPGLFTLFTSPG